MVLIGNVYIYCPCLPFLPLFYGAQIILAKHISSTYQLSSYYLWENKMIFIGNVCMYCPVLPFLPHIYDTSIFIDNL